MSEKSSALPSPPRVTIDLELSSQIFERTASKECDLIKLVAKTTLHGTETITLDTRGLSDVGTVLEDTFSFELFEWYDQTSGEFIERPPQEGSGDFGGDLAPYQALELRPGIPLITEQYFDAISPLADPLRLVKAGHEYRIRLKPQDVWWIAKRKQDLFGDQKYLHNLPEVQPLCLKAENEVTVKVEGSDEELRRLPGNDLLKKIFLGNNG